MYFVQSTHRESEIYFHFTNNSVCRRKKKRESIESNRIEPIPFIDILPKNFKVKNTWATRNTRNFCINFGQWNDTALLRRAQPEHGTLIVRHKSDTSVVCDFVLFGCLQYTACFWWRFFSLYLESVISMNESAFGNHSIKNRSFVCSFDRSGVRGMAWAALCVCVWHNDI